MGGLMKYVTRFGIKVGILGGAIYYSREIGIWGDSKKTYEIAQIVSSYTKPYFKSALHEFQTQYPSTQELPTVADLNRSATLCWNKGVIKSVDFLTNLPCMLSKYSNEGITYVTKQLQQEKNTASPNKKTENS